MSTARFCHSCSLATADTCKFLRAPRFRFFSLEVTQTVYWILAASKGWLKQTYRKIMRTQNTQCTQNHTTGNDLIQI